MVSLVADRTLERTAGGYPHGYSCADFSRSQQGQEAQIAAVQARRFHGRTAAGKKEKEGYVMADYESNAQGSIKRDKV